MADQERKLTKAELARKEAFERRRPTSERRSRHAADLSGHGQRPALVLALAVVLGAGSSTSDLSFVRTVAASLCSGNVSAFALVAPELIHGIAWSA